MTSPLILKAGRVPDRQEHLGKSGQPWVSPYWLGCSQVLKLKLSFRLKTSSDIQGRAESFLRFLLGISGKGSFPPLSIRSGSGWRKLGTLRSRSNREQEGPFSTAWVTWQEPQSLQRAQDQMTVAHKHCRSEQHKGSATNRHEDRIETEVGLDWQSPQTYQGLASLGNITLLWHIYLFIPLSS